MKSLLFLQNLGAGEIIIIALVVLLLFGGKKIPELMRGIGKGVRSFKEGISDVEKEIGGIEDDVKKAGNDEKKYCLLRSKILRQAKCHSGTISRH